MRPAAIFGRPACRGKGNPVILTAAAHGDAGW
jgi:hypothetical protein